ncbi:GAF domain-containing protein [Cryobacterium psychrophilum]|uniref:GAF domain-containing protein n=1 Tax=Cryobacterium psychrophilum TaxID=41988 RepID=A0A4Y8KJ80_9MICO|nr:GAF domain-containing protein [Cryobacterium psychrophilum]TDW31573.1 GAF domain-containing protein [Cryobacterium psychrophilum]TFD75200.1 GAF domain-containing protein [Cryobacterium psychrophilum]
MTEFTADLVSLVARLGNALGVATRPTALEGELNRATAAIRALFDAAAASCALVQSEGNEIRFIAANGIGATMITGRTMPVERGIAGWVAMTGQPIAIANVSVDARFARDVAEETSYIPTSILAAPLLGEDGEVLGVIEVLDARAINQNTGRDLDILGLIGSQLAATVRLSTTFDRLGSVLLTALADAKNDEDFARALASLADADDAGKNLAELALAIHRISDAGPNGQKFALTVLTAALDYSRGRA